MLPPASLARTAPGVAMLVRVSRLDTSVCSSVLVEVVRVALVASVTGTSAEMAQVAAFTVAREDPDAVSTSKASVEPSAAKSTTLDSPGAGPEAVAPLGNANGKATWHR